MNKSLDFFDLKLAEKVGNIFEYAIIKQGIDFYTFTKHWVESDTFLALLEWDVAMVSQAPTYIYAKFIEEMQKNKQLLKNEPCEEFPECINWVGYFLTYWCLRDNITWNELQKKCNLSIIIKNCFIYHTVGIKTAINMVQEDSKQYKEREDYGTY